MVVRSHNILLVEDDENDVFLIKRAFRLQNSSHSLQVVQDGEIALNYLKGEEQYENRELYPLPSLILLDLKLPRLSGLEVLQWIRQQVDLKRMLVVVLTASREAPDVNRAYDLGANSYLVKPVDFQTFLEMVRTLDAYWLMFNERPLFPIN
ncbi:response regulator [Lyngbya aestuarii]|uniref:response regulator n=1 Tax=Lyngbya aestuarii TaxID=118322 RepID=UPI00403DD792